MTKDDIIMEIMIMNMAELMLHEKDQKPFLNAMLHCKSIGE